MAEKKRQSLGRGLSSLLGEEPKAQAVQNTIRGSRQVPVESLIPGRYQPRHFMDEEKIEELAQSVRENGIIQPLLVRPHPEQENAFEIIAGERRWRAAQLAKVHEVPVLIKDLTDQEALEIGLVENLQRQDLSVLEEADGYQRLIEEFSHTQEVLAKTVGKSRSHVANMMRLLGLPDGVKKMLDRDELSAGHARALLNAPDPEEAARQVLKQGLNVRQTERLVKKIHRKKSAPPVKARKDVDTLALERDLANLLGLKVSINFKGEGGALTVHYDSLEQLDDILMRLGHADGAPTGMDSQKEPEITPVKKPVKKSPKLSIGMKPSSGARKKAS
ncbi:MAG: ParB/RepB/Spo0J family partition protein [Alphaproteobacteria bacterium]|nr:ParB/RepB/Spo0J family partition protein [Alphaproteobacteria bacterium]